MILAKTLEQRISNQTWLAKLTAVTILAWTPGCDSKAPPAQTQGPPTSASPATPMPNAYDPSTPLRSALRPGDSSPKVHAAGWINGPPDAADANEITVIDLWAQWCPFSASTAPELVRVYDAYKERGVRFVSLTSDDEASAKYFATSHGINWPIGFGIDAGHVDEWGARQIGGPPGYEIKPTLYIMNADGQVLFSDGHLRYLHTEPAETAGRLSKALDEIISGRSASTAGNQTSATGKNAGPTPDGNAANEE